MSLCWLIIQLRWWTDKNISACRRNTIRWKGAARIFCCHRDRRFQAPASPSPVSATESSYLSNNSSRHTTFLSRIWRWVVASQKVFLMSTHPLRKQLICCDLFWYTARLHLSCYAAVQTLLSPPTNETYASRLTSAAHKWWHTIGIQSCKTQFFSVMLAAVVKNCAKMLSRSFLPLST